jgi:hypothetical protein
VDGIVIFDMMTLTDVFQLKKMKEQGDKDGPIEFWPGPMTALSPSGNIWSSWKEQDLHYFG